MVVDGIVLHHPPPKLDLDVKVSYSGVLQCNILSMQEEEEIGRMLGGSFSSGEQEDHPLVLSNDHKVSEGWR